MKKQLLMLVLGLLSLALNAQINLVKNLSPTSNNGIFNNIIKYNDKVYFAGRESSNTNWELYASDGTNAGTVKVKEIAPGATGGGPNEFYVWEATNELYFNASGATSCCNNELWKTDGTSAGTIKVSEFDPAGNGNPLNMAGTSTRLFMSARESSIGAELGATTGTLASSAIVKDIRSGSLSSSPQEFFVYNNTIYFTANSGIDGSEIWTSNGTNAGTVQFKDINPNGGSSPAEYTRFNNLMYFAATTNANGRELWVSNGTSAGTVLVQDINIGTVDSSPENLTVYNNRLYFTATTSIFGTELYYIGTSGSVALAQDIQPLAASSNPSDLFVYDGKLYFTAGDGINGRELWVTDGTIPGTIMLKDINPSGSSNPKNFQTYNGKLYFSASNKLWVTDGTAVGTVQIPNSPNEPEFLTVLDDLLLFKANGGSGIGRELYSYFDPTLSSNEVEQIAIGIFPNPTSSYFSINSNKRVEEVTVTDLLGKVIKVFNMPQERYDISNVAAGVLVIAIKTQQGLTTKKIIKKG